MEVLNEYVAPAVPDIAQMTGDDDTSPGKAEASRKMSDGTKGIPVTKVTFEKVPITDIVHEFGIDACGNPCDKRAPSSGAPAS
jgi:hypothetical protein